MLVSQIIPLDMRRFRVALRLQVALTVQYILVFLLECVSFPQFWILVHRSSYFCIHPEFQAVLISLWKYLGYKLQYLLPWYHLLHIV